MCGATGGQTAAQANEVKISDLLTQDFQTVFGTNQNLLNTLTKSLSPTVQAGPNQYGFSPGQDAAMRTQATEQIGAASQNATNSVRGAVAGQGGMNLPSGSESAIESGLAQNESFQQAGAQLGITEKGYEAGRENYFQSVGDLAQAPGQLENPATSAGTAAMGGAQGQMQGATDIANANNAWIAPVAGMIGSVAGAAIPHIPSFGGGGGLAPAGSIPAAANGGTFIDPLCWVAAEVFGGWYEPRTVLVREWLTTEFVKSIVGRVVVASYRRFGQTWAEWVRTNKLARQVATALMNRALIAAQNNSQ